MKLDNNAKTFLKYFGVWYIVAFVIDFIPAISSNSLAECLLCFILPLCGLGIIVLCFLPIHFIHFFLLYKFIKNKFLLFVSVLTLYSLYFLLFIQMSGNKCSAAILDEWDMPILTTLYYWFVPTFLMVISCLNKNEKTYKREILSLILLAFIVGNTLGYSFLLFKHFSALHQLDKYKPVIEYVENYKKEHGTYPQNIDTTIKYSDKLPFYEYKTYNDNKDFILHTNTQESSFYGYRYCSNNSMLECSEDETSCPRVNNWLEFRTSD